MSEKQETKTEKAAETAMPTPNGMITPEPQITPSEMSRILILIDHVLGEFMKETDIDSAMTGRERLRLFGVKSRNYGFISKAWDIARDNPEFVPPNFSMSEMQQHIQLFEQVRQLTMVLEQFQHAATDYLMITSDNAYRDALRIYGSLREQTRGRVPGAQALFDELLQYFTLHRRGRVGAEPTEKELERDFHSLIHGHKEGEIIIKNESPHVSGGVRTVVDDVHSGHAAIKETGEEKIDT
jgi:hypothetical protein